MIGGLAGCSRGELTILDAWIPEAPPNVMVLAGYMTIDNRTDLPRTLVGATAAPFERIEFHRTVYEKESGLATMVSLDKVELAPGETLLFTPGGHHLMLVHPERALREGEGVPLTLVFADGMKVTTLFKVRRERLRL